MPLYTRNTNVIDHFFLYKFLLTSHQISKKLEKTLEFVKRLNELIPMLKARVKPWGLVQAGFVHFIKKVPNSFTLVNQVWKRVDWVETQ